jgi:hypothetical protein
VARPPRDGFVVAVASALLVWYRVRLALPAPLGGYRLLHRRAVAETKARRSRGTGEPERTARLAALFGEAVAHAVAGQACVPRSLALARLLALHDLPAEVRVGLRRTDEGLTGHAWVEQHGTVVGDRNEFVSTFVPFLPGQRPRLQEGE